MYYLPSRRLARTIGLVVAVVTGPAATVVAQPASSFSQGWQSGTPTSVTGLLTARVADDFKQRKSAVSFRIEDERTRRSYPVQFATGLPKLRPGSRVRIVGRMAETTLYVACCDATANTQANSNITVLTSATSVVAGEQKTILIITNFADKSTRVTAADLETVMFTGGPNPGRSVDGLYRASSFGNIWFNGTVVGPFTIGASAVDPCQPDKWVGPADAAAAAAGIDLASYRRRVYVMPGNPNCGFGGISDVGVIPSRSIMFADNADFGLPVDLFAHELGHALGMLHATTPSDEYGDLSDVMGNGGFDLPRENNAPHKIQMGWIPASRVNTITQTGIYSVGPLEADPATAVNPQVLVLAKPDTGDFYYVSYRVATGFDSQLTCCGYLDRLSVHRWNPNSANVEKTSLVGTVSDGGTFTDTSNGITVTLTSRTQTAALVQVQLPGCAPAAPSISLTPSSQTGPPGTTVGYDVAIVNNDSRGCPATAFSLGGTIPTGWNGSLSQASMNLIPESTGRATLTLTAPATAPVGTYTSTVNVADVAVPVHAASMIGALNVVAPCTMAPTLSILPATQSASAGAKLTYSVNITNKDLAGCASTTFIVTPSVPDGWTAAVSPSRLMLASGASGLVTYDVTSPTEAAAATYSIQAAISDGATVTHSALIGASYSVRPKDTSAPTAPSTLLAVLKRGQVNLSWAASTDNLAVAGYRVWRNGAAIATVTGTTWVDLAATTGTYTYSVVAYDVAGNVSPSSPTAVVTIRTGRK